MINQLLKENLKLKQMVERRNQKLIKNVSKPPALQAQEILISNQGQNVSEESSPQRLEKF
jgi:hypothetical protein